MRGEARPGDRVLERRCSGLVRAVMQLAVVVSAVGASAGGVVLDVPLEEDCWELDGAVCREGHVLPAERDVGRDAVNGNAERVFASHCPAQAENAFDGNDDTFWSPAPHPPDGAFLGVDLGRQETITAVEWDGHTYGEGFPESFELLTSLEDAEHRGPAAKGAAYTRIDEVTLVNSAGERRYPTGAVVGNIDSHRVRLEFPPCRVRQVCVRVLRTHLLGQHPRLTRFAVLAPPAPDARATATLRLSAPGVRAWRRAMVEGKGVRRTECRWRGGPEDAWSEWHRVEGPCPSQMGAVSIPDAEFRVTLAREGPPEDVAPVLTGFRLEVEGTIARRPTPLTPPMGSELGNPTPTFMWRPDGNARYLGPVRYDVQVSPDAGFPEAQTVSVRAEATDVATVPEAAKLSRRGRYYWRVRCAPGQPGTDSRFSETRSFALGGVRRPSSNNSPFGMNMGIDRRPWGAKLAREAGHRWTRADFAWYQVWPSPDTWRWTSHDSIAAAARETGISILGVLGFPARWSRQEPSTTYYQRRPPADLGQWVRYVYETVRRYRNDVGAWEVWNEHNHRGFYVGTPREYAFLLKTAYVLIRNIQPHVPVTFGGHAGFNARYVDEVAKHIGHGYWDILNWHCYPGWPDDFYYRMWVDRVLAYQRERGMRRPIWLTEVGTMRSKGSSEDEIAARLVALFVANMQAWPGAEPNRIEKTFYFQFCEGHGFGDPLKSQWAIIVDHPDPAREPDKLAPFHSLQTAVRMLEGATWTDRAEERGVVAHTFDRPGQSPPVLTVVWAGPKDAKGVEVAVEHEGPLTVLDMYGKPVPVDAAGGHVVRLAVPRRPTYVLSTRPVTFRRD